MKKLVATSIAFDLSEVLQVGFTGQVHSVFREACNIITTDGELISLLAPRLSDGPGVIRVSDWFNQMDTLAVGTPVSGTSDFLVLGDTLRISLAEATIWHSRLPGFPPEKEWPALLNRVAMLEAAQQSNVANHSLFYVTTHTDPYLKVMAELLQTRSQLLVTSLKKQEFFEACQNVKPLTGLGIGLTPSGDDFLAGLFLVLRLGMKEAQIPLAWFERCLNGMAEQTNIISLKSIEASVRSQSWAVTESFLSALFTGTDSEVDAAVAKVLAIGSTSGSDSLVGILAGIKVVINLGGQINDINSGNSKKYVY